MILCLERAHGCLGAWEGGPVVPGPPPLGPWGASRGLQGGWSRAQLRTPPNNLRNHLHGHGRGRYRANRFLDERRERGRLGLLQVARSRTRRCTSRKTCTTTPRWQADDVQRPLAATRSYFLCDNCYNINSSSVSWPQAPRADMRILNAKWGLWLLILGQPRAD